ncbi:hypothetical protein [Cellulosimicrobium sp. TH-20]|uniref:hypothetical protein n=1 Tax=Cellulosimicrobium sp. TH-20 TaxID=1980001 RepID=UPI001582C45B
MPVILPERIRVPAPGDSYALTEDLRKMMESARTIVPVANETDRAAVVAALAAASRPVSSSAPLIVERADAPEGAQLEMTTDGTKWRTLATESAPVTPTRGDGWETVAGAGHRLRLVRIGNMAHVFGSVQRSTGSTGSILKIPTAMQPPTVDTRPVGVAVASNSTFGVIFIGSGELKAVAGYGNLSGSGSYVLPLSGLCWPLTWPEA